MFNKNNIKSNIKYIKYLIKFKKNFFNEKKKKIIKIYNKIIINYKNINLIYKLYKKKNYEINFYEKKINNSINKILKIIFKKKFNNNVIIKINNELGGKDSYNWKKKLENMYIMWAKNNNYNYSYNKKKNIIKIKGKFIYGFLCGENGIHKLIRISPFNKKKKRQTSLAYVNIIINKKKKKIY